MGYIMELRKMVGSRPLLMVGAAVLVLNEQGKLLLQLRKDNGHWGLPGGSLEVMESLEETASRELLEETGLSARNVEFFELFSGEEFHYIYPHGDEVYNVIAAFICRAYEGDLTPQPGEVSALHFFALDDLPEQISPPDFPIIKRFTEKRRSFMYE
ncbi:NUDIX hydrolase [Pradoshia sp.]